MRNEHGGDIAGYRLQYGKDPLDFSASLNPLGMPPAVRQAAINAVDGACAYPDPLARELTRALAQKLGVKQEHLLLGNGAADLIYRCVQAARPRRALVPVPAFAEYEQALRSAGCEVRFYQTKPAEEYVLDAGFADAITTGDEMVFLCQPGNPTGQLTPPGLVGQIAARCRKLGALLFVDECFLPFVPGAARHSLVKDADKRPGLFLLGSFTKLYAIAGLRLGYGLCADAALLEKTAACGQPWGVSAVAQAAGLAALAQEDYVRESLALIATEKEWLAGALEKLGCGVIGKAANYLFFAAGVPDLKERLMEKGILIRDCSNFRGLGAGHYRIAVRTRGENEQLVEAMQEVFEAREAKQ